jgi:polar amino acid transport system substrate-binding protein
MKVMKTLLFLLLAVFLLIGCAEMQKTQTTARPVSPVLDRILQRGALVVGTSGRMPPMSMVTRDNRLIGMEIDMARAVAGAMGVELKLEIVPFAELLPALETGRIDMILSNMTITPARNLKAAFVGPYFESGKAFLTKLKTIASTDDAAKLNSPETRLVTLRGSTSQAFVEEVIPKATLFTAADYDEAVRMVLDDKVQAMLADYPICVISVYRYPDAGLISLITPITYEPIGIAVPKGDPHLVNWLENLLFNWEEAGMLEHLRERWFARGDWLKDLP